MYSNGFQPKRYDCKITKIFPGNGTISQAPYFNGTTQILLYFIIIFQVLLMVAGVYKKKKIFVEWRRLLLLNLQLLK